MSDTTHVTPPARLGPVSRARIGWALARVDVYLDGRISGRQRRGIRRELRANLVEAARHRGAKEAVAGLGDLRDLARGYVDAEVSDVRWRSGTVAASATFLLLVVATDVFHVGFTAALREVGSDRPVAYSYELWDGFGPLRGSADPAAGVFEVSLLTPFHLLTIVLVYIVAARLWRWRPSR